MPLKPAFPGRHLHCAVRLPHGPYPDSTAWSATAGTSRDDCEVRFWRQSNRLVQAPKIWETARAEDPSFTCANLFWWFNMYSTADVTVTPRPMYPADGRKLPDVYTSPAALRDELQAKLGHVSVVRVLGSARLDRVHTLDCRRRRSWSMSKYQPDADARLPAASRLQPPAGRTRPGRARGPAAGRRRRAAISSGSSRPAARDVIVVSEYGIRDGLDARCTSTGCCASTA